MKIQVNSIFKICIGISAIILSVAAFNFSIQKAIAAPPSPQEFLDAGTSKIGKYTMTMAGVASGTDKISWTLVIMDTETGKSKTYYKSESIAFGPSFRTDGTDIW